MKVRNCGDVLIPPPLMLVSITFSTQPPPVCAFVVFTRILPHFYTFAASTPPTNAHTPQCAFTHPTQPSLYHLNTPQSPRQTSRTRSLLLPHPTTTYPHTPANKPQPCFAPPSPHPPPSAASFPWLLPLPGRSPPASPYAP